MLVRRSVGWLILAASLACGGVAAADVDEFKDLGEVTDVADDQKQASVSLEGANKPLAGEKVVIFEDLDGIRADVAEGTIARVDGKKIQVTIDNASSRVLKGHRLGISGASAVSGGGKGEEELSGEWTLTPSKDPPFGAEFTNSRTFRLEKSPTGAFVNPGSSNAKILFVKDKNELQFLNNAGIKAATAKLDADPKTGAIERITWSDGSVFTRSGAPSGGAGGVPPASGLDAELAEIAKGIVDLLKEKNLDSIAVGQFTGPAQSASSSGPSIAHSLTEQLESRGIKVPRFRAELQVKGDYQDVVDNASGQPAVKITARVLDKSGNVIGEFVRGVIGAETVAQTLGATVEVPPGKSEEQRTEAVLVSIEKPDAHLDNNRVQAGPNSPFAVEVLVKSNGKYEVRKPKEEEGFAFVEIQRDESYAVRLINDSTHEVAVKLTIDGLNMFTFSDNDSYKKLGVVIIPAGKSGVIKGWHRNNTTSDEFLVTEYAKSAAGAAGLKSESDLGVITATFHAAWPKGSPPPSDEPQLASRSSNATGRGPAVGVKYSEVERNIGQFRAAVSVRYAK